MKKIRCNHVLIFLVLFVVNIAIGQSRPNNSISGFVYDSNRNPVPDVYVELMNDVYSTLGRVKTDGSGRFSFNGVSSGEFKVKVLPYGTNFAEEVQDATIINFTIGSTRTSDNVYLDFYLKLDKRKINDNEPGLNASVFVQDVPSEAKNLYKKSVSQLEKPKDEKIGLENLKKTLEIFPNYYDALNRIGYEHVKRGQYIESLPYLIKAIEVNERSFSSFYLLGLSAYNLKQIKQSVLAFQGATTINPQSVNAYLKYGMVLRIDGQFKEAEQALLRANTLSKNTGIPEVHWQLALLYDKIGRYNDAATELETYLKLNPNVENIQQIKELITVMRTKAKQKV